MYAKTPLAASLVLALALASAPAPAAAGPLVLTIQNGRVILFAQDVSLRQILTEWERVGGTRIVHKERVPASMVTLDLAEVPEDKALEMLLRPVAGFAAVARADKSTGASKYARILIMAGASAPLLAGAAPMSGGGQAAGGAAPVRPQMQSRVMPDGRRINFVENQNRPGELTVVDDDGDPVNEPGQPPGMMRPPFNAPPGAERGQMTADPYQLGGQGGQGGQPGQPGQPAGAPTMSPVPSILGATAPTPGAVVPGVRPNQTTPPGPPKPPGR